MKKTEFIEEVKKAVAKTGALEIYRTYNEKEKYSYHIDYIGDYVGEDYADIPEEIRWYDYEIMNAEEYDATGLAGGSNPADYVCEETGLTCIFKYMPYDLTPTEIDAIKKLLYTLDLDAENWEVYYDSDTISINKGRDGNTYAWLCDEVRNEALNIETGTFLTKEEIEEQFC